MEIGSFDAARFREVSSLKVVIGSVIFCPS
jgi:hypothetical protein